MPWQKKKVAHETEDADVGFAAVNEAIVQLDKAQREPARPQDVLEFTREGMDIASKEFTNWWALNETARANLKRCFQGGQ